jgi:hypothetical protein
MSTLTPFLLGGCLLIDLCPGYGQVVCKTEKQSKVAIRLVVSPQELPKGGEIALTEAGEFFSVTGQLLSDKALHAITQTLPVIHVSLPPQKDFPISKFSKALARLNRIASKHKGKEIMIYVHLP